MEIKSFVKNGQRYGRVADGTEVGPLQGGSKNLHLGRTEYMCQGRPYYEPFRSTEEEEPEPSGGWI